MTCNDRLTFVAQLPLALCSRSHLRSHGDMGDHVHVRNISLGGDLICADIHLVLRASASSTAAELYALE